MVISYRRFGTTYWSHRQGSRIQGSGNLLSTFRGSIFRGQESERFFTHEDGTDRFSRNVGKKLPLLAA